MADGYENLSFFRQYNVDFDRQIANLAGRTVFVGEWVVYSVCMYVCVSVWIFYENFIFY